MSTVEKSKLQLAYEGSVKRVFQCPRQDDALLFEFTDDYSVFDWGKMPDTIKNKGRALSLFGAFFFEQMEQASYWQDLVKQEAPPHLDPDFLHALISGKLMQLLQKQGLSSHYQGLVDQNGQRLSLAEAASAPAAVYMQVRKALVQRPEDMQVLHQNIFYYPPADNSAPARLIPLEIVFRFGMPQGSSLTARLKQDPAYAQLLGLKGRPQEGQMFDRPVLEFFSKLEPKDRLLSVQEALLISGLEQEQFLDLVERAQLAALALFYHFRRQGIELWDGKFEFILAGGKVLLADSIGPDELRLLYRGTHLSKEMIRQVYRGTSWELALQKAQKLAKERCTLDWKSICLEELNESPEHLNESARAVLDRLYAVLVNSASGQQLFAGEPGLEEFQNTARVAGL